MALSSAHPPMFRLCTVCHRDIKILRVWVQAPGCDPQLSLRAMTVGCRSRGGAGGPGVGLVTQGLDLAAQMAIAVLNGPGDVVTTAAAIDAPTAGTGCASEHFFGRPGHPSVCYSRVTRTSFRQ
jgi:hypothetical protein